MIHNQPIGIQCYTGNWLDGSITGTKGGATYNQHAAVCLETQLFPNTPNIPSFPGNQAILRPGQLYRHVVCHRFTTDDAIAAQAVTA
jgi:aldose 1-epimerase